MSVSRRSAGLGAGKLLAGAALLSLAGCSLYQSPGPFDYPQTRKCDQVDDYHGTLVADPYRWLEDGGSPEVRAWIEAQNRLTFDYLRKLPGRERIRQRLTELWDYEKLGVPRKYGGRYFYARKEGLQNQYVLFTMPSLDSEPRVLLDPNALSEDGTVSLQAYSVSDDGEYLAYGLSTSGSDWQEWKVREVKTGRDLPDHIKWVKYSNVSWTKDGEGFFYCGYDEPREEGKYRDASYGQKLLYHRMGTPQSQDTLVYHRPDRNEWLFQQSVSDDGGYLVVEVEQGDVDANLIYYKDLAAGDSPIVELIAEFDARYTFVESDGSVLWFHTNLDAPRGRLIAIDTLRPGKEHWKEIIPQADATLRRVSAVGGRFVASYLRDAHSQVKIFGIDGRAVGEVSLPGLGTAWGFSGRRDDPETFYQYARFTAPDTTLRYDVTTGASEVFHQAAVDIDPDAYVTRQVFYRSKDGTQVPMFISHKKGITLDGDNPTYLYGYGGFNITETPRFSVVNLVWMEMGGVYAVPNIRGGGEYGREWHHAGTKLRKQSTFDDFIAAAEWLIQHRYTSPAKLAIGGASNGGLLVGACMTQRPDLFGACMPDVGVMDMLRFHKFTIGWAWVADYGSAEDPEEFQALYAYSPLHNLKAGMAYPATLVTTADHDDRVVPAHSFKFTAALQAAQAGPAPVLIRIETKAGHGAGTPSSMLIEKSADEWAFVAEALDMRME